MKVFCLKVCSWGGRDSFHSIAFDLKLGNKLVREVVKISHNINIKMKTAITEIILPNEETVFQANSGSG